ncbi:hypothetical protein BV25DRAFT_1902787 [Artomyces pyxidatus]|uniref:Uncharacterized protein n=1 Tax=Artomyces pyxidatus TaxID=48021 RepID=A0ACB8SLP8_9AGAM|nr:hypothetical protein BV25DRAFT_1902787 [Artomyces pyxidatus]
MDSTHTSTARATAAPLSAIEKSQSEKTAEFARLFYFFEKLTQPRTGRISPTRITAEDATDAFVPTDIAPLLKNLSSILAKPVPADTDDTDTEFLDVPDAPTTSRFPMNIAPITNEPAPPPSSRRRNTVSTQTMTPRTARFPLDAKRYQFTFKMLMHRLYDIDTWGNKVREILAASQEQYRSLESAPPAPPTPSGGVFQPLESPPARTRQRSLSTAKGKAKEYAQLGLGAAPAAPRALKKRIVNRRRSVSGPGLAPHGEGWIYDAAVSQVDVEAEMERKQGVRVEERRRKRVFSSAGFEETERTQRRLVGRDLTNRPAYVPPPIREGRVHFEEGRARKRSHIA